MIGTLWRSPWTPILLTLLAAGPGLYGWLTKQPWLDPGTYIGIAGVAVGVLWTLWTAIRPAAADPVRVGALLDDYAEQVAASAQRLRLGDLFAEGDDIPLERVFVPMTATWRRAEHGAGKGRGDGLAGTGEPEALPVTDALNEIAAPGAGPPRAVLLGEAGSGKSSVVADLLQRCATDDPGPDWPERLCRRRVLRVNLRELGCRRRSSKGAAASAHDDADCPPVRPRDFWALVGRAICDADPGIRAADHPAFAELAVAELRRRLKRHGLLLLDALDEVLNLDQRRAVAGLIGALSDELGPDCIILVTGRPYAYSAAELPGFRVMDLQPLAAPATDAEPAERRDAPIARLVHNWYACFGCEGQASALVAELLADPDLIDMAEHPLLLTLLVAVALDRLRRGTADGTALPGDRAQLMDKATALFIDTWLLRIERADPGSAPQAEMDRLRALPPAALRCTVQDLAHTLQHGRRASQGRVRVVETTGRLFFAALRDCCRWPQHMTQRQQEDIERVVLERNNLVYPLGAIEDGKSRYAFVHRLFVEYLAACELVVRDHRGEGDGLAAELGRELLADPGTWGEVARFVPLCRARREGGELRADDALAAAHVLRELLDRPAPAAAERDRCYQAMAVLGRALHDLGRALAGTPALKPQVAENLAGAKARFDRWLLALADDPRAGPPARLAMGRAAGRLGDPRPGVIPRDHAAEAEPFPLQPDDFAWIEVPAGDFAPGSRRAELDRPDNDAAKAYPDELNEAPPAHLPGFAISRYPVTQAQFAAFTAAGGYLDPARPGEPPPWWTFSREAERWWDGRNPGLQVHKQALRDMGREDRVPAYERWLARRPRERRRRPWFMDDPGYAERTLPNHPVIGLSWFEAMAFCGWLTAAWRERDWLGPDQAIALPSEVQWERAARGGGSERRPWPWGDWRDWAERFAEPANAEPAGLGGVTAVGLFPAEPPPWPAEPAPPSDGDRPPGPRDLAGNVWEWTLTRWGDKAGAPTFTYPPSDDGRDDPYGADLRCTRGGSWLSTPRGCRSAFRDGGDPGFWGSVQGFRVVRVSLA